MFFRMQKSKAVEVFYDPLNPEKAVLIKGIYSQFESNYKVIKFGFLFMLVITLLKLIKRRNY